MEALTLVLIVEKTSTMRFQIETGHKIPIRKRVSVPHYKSYVRWVLFRN